MREHGEVCSEVCRSGEYGPRSLERSRLVCGLYKGLYKKVSGLESLIRGRGDGVCTEESVFGEQGSI